MTAAFELTQSVNGSAYTAEILSWRQQAEDRLREENGWLTLTGLYWLHEGENTIGSDPTSDILLPDAAPQQVGIIDFHGNTATLRVTTDSEVLIDGTPTKSAPLRDDYDPQGLTRVVIGAVNFHVVKRADQYGIRVRDQNNPARQAFSGRSWFPIDPTYRVMAKFTPYPKPRDLDTETVVGIDIPMPSPGYVEFTLAGQNVRLEAFSSHDSEIWFVFRDSSSLTYRAGRFLYATVNPDNTVIMDFNQAYNPPCAFTPYATCPLPPRQNILSFPIEIGEQASQHP